MKKQILLSLFILSWLMSHGQIIKGRVLDNSTRQAVTAAYIYFNGTMAVAMSDVNGNFELDISKYKDMPLTISAIGYHSVTLANPAKENPLTVLLTPKTYELGEIKVVAKGKVKKATRAKYMKLFKEEFLGLNYQLMGCEIANEDDISFTESLDDGKLEALARNPIQVINKRLGYKITFYLDAFSHNRNTKETACGGNFLFTDLSLTDSTLKNQYNKERYSVFRSSRLQFFRSLWCDSLSTNGFSIHSANKEKLNPKDVVVTENEKKYLYHSGDLYIRFHTPIGYVIDNKISFTGKPVYFNSNGYFDGTALLWNGFMGNQRMSDFLPYDYKPIIPVKPELKRRSNNLNAPRKAAKTTNLGNAQMECIYNYTVNAPLKKNKRNKKNENSEKVLETYTTILQTNGSTSKFWDWNNYMTDSIYQFFSGSELDRFKEQLYMYYTTEHLFNPVVFKNYPDGKLTTIEMIYPEDYIYEENKEPQNWQLKDDTLRVCGYLCNKATLSRGGLKWTAWYTPEIAVSDGPWKLYGLPGLILKAVDSTATHLFEATTIRKATLPISMEKNDLLIKVKKDRFIKERLSFEKRPFKEIPMRQIKIGALYVKPGRIAVNLNDYINVINGKRSPKYRETEYCPLELE